MKELTSIFKLLSDDTRLRIILLLYQENLCVCQLSGILEIAQPTISKNLSKLRDLNLVSDERKDKFVIYTLRRDHPLLTLILEQLLQNIDLYPQMKSDALRLKDKEQYLITCCPK